MKIEDLFKFGATPKEGKFAGKRFRVLEIRPNWITVSDWDDTNSEKMQFSSGTHDVWKQPKTLFEDDNIIATIGELKKAIEESGLDDNTRIYVSQGNFFTTFSSGALVNPSFRLTKVYSSHGTDSKTAIVIS